MTSSSIAIIHSEPVSIVAEIPDARDYRSMRKILSSHNGRTILPASVCGALEIVSHAPEVRKIILFGSRAVGDNNERSDFDIAISAPEITKEKLSILRDALLHSRTLYKISLSQLEMMPVRLIARVMSQGVVIYERQKT